MARLRSPACVTMVWRWGISVEALGWVASSLRMGLRCVMRAPTVWLTWLAKLVGRVNELEDSGSRIERM